MQNHYNWPLWHWHFEASSICTLKCPRCPRTEIPDTLVQKQLRLDFFEKNFDLPEHIKKITFCGDDGDPIYAKDLIDIVAFFKDRNPNVSVTIITNGSYKDDLWWARLGKVLNSQDEVKFSLDGWDQESNSKYRVNCDWRSIESGAKVLRKISDAIIGWDAIAFGFNQDRIEHMKSIAQDWGFDRFQLTKSTKFGSKYDHYNDTVNSVLEPSAEFIPNGHRFERDITLLTNRRIDDSEIIKANLLHFDYARAAYDYGNTVPLCFIGTKGMFVNSQGYFIPCCWIGNRYNHNGIQQFLKPEFNIEQQGLETVLNHPQWEYFIAEFDRTKECNEKCAKHLVTEEYATSW